MQKMNQGGRILSFKKTILVLLLLLCTPIWAIHFSDSRMKPPLGRVPYWPAFEQPVAMYLFTEGAGGIVNDFSGNGNTGTITTPDWRGGPFGKCLYFDASTTRINCGSKSVLDTMPNFTLTVWMYVMGYPEDNIGNFFNKYELRLYWNRTGDGEHLTGEVYYGTTKAISKSYDIGDAAVTNFWHHIAMTFSESDKIIRLYFDGIESPTYIIQTAGVGTRTSDSGRDLFIGCEGIYNRGHFNGLLDIPIIYNRVLTASQIAYLYRNSFPWFAPRNEWWGGTIAIPTGVGQFIFINMN